MSMKSNLKPALIIGILATAAIIGGAVTLGGLYNQQPADTVPTPTPTLTPTVAPTVSPTASPTRVHHHQRPRPRQLPAHHQVLAQALAPVQVQHPNPSPQHSITLQ